MKIRGWKAEEIIMMTNPNPKSYKVFNIVLKADERILFKIIGIYCVRISLEEKLLGEHFPTKRYDHVVKQVFTELMEGECSKDILIQINWDDGAYDMFIVDKIPEYEILSADEAMIKDIIE
jgi:hypothetical protein